MYETLSDTKILLYNAIKLALEQKIVYEHQKRIMVQYINRQYKEINNFKQVQRFQKNNSNNIKHFCNIAFTGQCPFLHSGLAAQLPFTSRFTETHTCPCVCSLVHRCLWNSVALHEHAVICCLHVDSSFTTCKCHTVLHVFFLADLLQ